ncbi:hypothetical protein DYB32_007413 [Aphanomyces invadans]|uniref:Uncharacterized protein n=1 Tax=Aphanomyces invadans TaxID=157072 RepID=A0A3R7CWT6_9STRA|nr:hypothetical protein DYB32_007413 [Aphanomyces invadans]
MMCHHARAVKKDGSLHRLCAFHREKANSLQKVYATKRRQEARVARRLQFEAKKAKDVPVAPPVLPVPAKRDDWWTTLLDGECLEWTLDEDSTNLVVLSDDDVAFLSEAF